MNSNIKTYTDSKHNIYPGRKKHTDSYSKKAVFMDGNELASRKSLKKELKLAEI